MELEAEAEAPEMMAEAPEETEATEATEAATFTHYRLILYMPVCLVAKEAAAAEQLMEEPEEPEVQAQRE